MSAQIEVEVEYDTEQGDSVVRTSQTIELPSWCSGDPESGAALFLFGYAKAAEELHLSVQSIRDVVEGARWKYDQDVREGDWVKYGAANGHVMEAEVVGFWEGGGAKTRQFDAQHSSECPCEGREALPDW